MPVVVVHGCGRRGGRLGFTIPEMLAVVAIIVILLSLLLPGLGQSRHVAWKAVCASNLHQQGLALVQYTNDSNYYPGHVAWSYAGNAPAAVWPTRLRPYTRDGRGVFYDPAAPAGFRWQLKFGTPGGDYAVAADAEWGYELGELLLRVDRVPFSYGYNDWGRWNVLHNPQRGLGADLRGGVTVPHLKKWKVAAPSDMIAIGDNTNDGRWDYNMDPTQWWEYPGKLHFDGCNMVFCDAHVEWGLQSDWVDVNLSTQKGRDMSTRWNNHHMPDANQN